ncbi:Pfs, NACHT and WD domain protein [Aspergillus ibericus CBS 121593]|uniref:WD40 repeat-like protein n=1 Tax=Aspergillus ibericus CBS 121593 TaxID=1448316 RepID=A0A395H3L2_9EURO|nr:WD40 repeat-like protein [Aspergillus ibericus CBS 121593]RAL02210.1 WD40 repeat-like protein [Aspergillus ibericus CBS 121593]
MLTDTMNNSTTSYAGYNAGFQLGQNVGQIHNNYYNQLDDSKATDPELDKKRIQEEKGGLLRDSYRWVLDHDDFKDWRYTAGNQFLWIKGDPGKGKTMLICGIIDELSKKATQDDINIAYFFCQATNNRINSATAILQGLVIMIGKKQPLLQKHLPAKFLDNENGWFELRNVFQKILQDPAMKKTYLIIDALDECVIDQNRILEFLEEESSGHQHVKWIVSSRNWPSIEKYLNNTTGIRLQLELNEGNLTAAVDYFIKYKVEELSKRNRYTLEKRKMVESHLLLNAKGTFLWVALVCQQLRDISARHLQQELKDFPPGLDQLYRRMFRNIEDMKYDVELCLTLLGIITTVDRPITVNELSLYLEPRDEIVYDDLPEIIKLCGSFITLQDCTITLVHQSAQDFLLRETSQKIHSDGLQEIHYSIFSKSLRTLQKMLRRNIYKVNDPTLSISQIKQPDPDPLAAMRYACVYWVNHLNHYLDKIKTEERQEGFSLINTFLCQDLLHWLEALSLSGSIAEGARSMLRLEELLKRRTNNLQLIDRVQDAYRFIIDHKTMIENYPLQVYTSAIFFSPRSSITRTQFESEELKWMNAKSMIGESWSACLQTLEGHGSLVNSVVFSHDSKWLASASRDKTVKLWDAASGACLQTIEGHSSSVNSVVFSPDSKRLASASHDKTVKLWDAASGACLQMLEGHGDSVNSVVFSPDSKRLASTSNDKTVKLWDAASGAYLQTLEGHGDWVNSVVFSPDSKWLVSASSDKTIKLWDAASGACLQTLEGHGSSVNSVVFSHDSKRLASASCDKTIKLWDAASGACLQTLEGHGGWVNSVVFSHDSKRLASTSHDSTIKLWDAASGACLQTLEGHGSWVSSVVFSPDSKRLASASHDSTVKLWDTASGACLQTLEGHRDSVNSVVFSPNSKQLASASDDKTIKLWDAASGACLQTLKGHGDSVNSVVFSPDSKRLVSASSDKTIKLWDASGACLQMLKGHGGWVNSVVFSHDSKRLASTSRDSTIKLWDAASGACLQTLEGHGSWVSSVVFSPDSKRLASTSHDSTVKLWDAASGACLQTLEGHGSSVNSVVFSHDSKRLASTSDDKTVKLWDAASGACLQTLEGHGDSVTKHDLGVFILYYLANSPSSQANPEKLYSHGFGISSDRTWITWNSVKLLKLPSIFKISASAVTSSTICIGFHLGQVLILSRDSH